MRSAVYLLPSEANACHQAFRIFEHRIIPVGGIKKVKVSKWKHYI